MMAGNELEIKSPDGQTTLFLRYRDKSISIVHTRADIGLSVQSSIQLQKGTPAHTNLEGLFIELTNDNPDPITKIRLDGLGLRSQISMMSLARQTQVTLEDLLKSSELTNFTYDLSPRSRRYLAHTVALVTNSTPACIQNFIDEIEGNTDFARHVAEITAQQPDRLRATSDATIKLGRRLGWYAVVRQTKPRLVIETGVDKGLGSILLCEALRKNAQEGSPGRYLGTDINPAAGYLLAPPYSEFGEIKYGDSIETLKTVDSEVDVFVNDSDHSGQYEADEYATISSRLSDDAVILGDNAHATDKLADFADQTGRQFLFWQEKPVDHWYPGAGIGFAFNQT